MRAGKKANGTMRLAATVMLGVACLAWTTAALAQVQVDPQDLDKVFRSLEAPSATEMPQVFKDENGFIRFLGAPPSGRFVPPASVNKSGGAEAIARGFIGEHGGAFGIISSSVNFNARTRVVVDDQFVRMNQFYGDYPVLGGQIVVQVDAADDSIRNVMASILRDTTGLDDGTIRMTPVVTANQAAEEARTQESLFNNGTIVYTVSCDPELMVFAPTLFSMTGSPVLVWKVVLQPDTKGKAEMAVYINAATGELAFRHPLRADALNREIYDLNGTINNIATNDATLKRKEGEAATGIKAVDNAYDYLGSVYTFYKTFFGRDSYDDEGSTLKGYVGMEDEVNAFWFPAYKAMAFNNELITDDITAHEVTHGVTNDEVGFVYFGFSGALSEAYSDWGGEFTDLTNTYGNDSAAARWWIGEDQTLLTIDTAINGVTGLRYMKDPTVEGDPDRLRSPNLASIYSSYDDGGVHINSGIMNKLVYLLTDGDTFNGQKVRGMGINQVADLFYKALFLLTSSSDYYDLYYALGAASIDLGYSLEDRMNIAAGAKAVEIEPLEVTFLGLRDFRATPVTMKANSKHAIALTWTNAPGDTYEDLLLIRSVGGFVTQADEGTVLTVAHADTSYLDTDVVDGVDYYYTIIADLTASFPQMAFAKATAGTEAPSILTEAFGKDPLLGTASEMDLSYTQLTYTPVSAPRGAAGTELDGVSLSDYEATVRKNVYSLPVERNDVNGGALNLTFMDDNAVYVVTNGCPFPYFGKQYSKIYIGANGYITFQAGVDQLQQLNFPSLAGHFAIPRISFMFNDFAPVAGGEAWCRFLNDRVVVTFVDMPTWPAAMPTLSVGLTTVQTELFYSGVVRITYQDVGAINAVVGLSDGHGVPREPALEFSGVLQAYELADLTGLPTVSSKMSIAPIAPVFIDGSELANFTARVNLPAGLAGLPVLTATWTGTGAAPFADKGNGTGVFNWQTNVTDNGVFTVRVVAKLGAQVAYQDVQVSVGVGYLKPEARNLAISSDSPLEDPTQSRVVALGRPLTASYTYYHPQAKMDPALYGEGSSTLYWFRNGQMVYQLINRYTVPPQASKSGDRWWFGVVPVSANYVAGEMVFSPVVTMAGFPELESITPAFGLTIGGDLLTLKGQRLSNVTSVSFGGVKGSNLRVINDTEIQVTTPLHAAGVVDVVVESSDGIGRMASGFRFIGGAGDLVKEDINKDTRVDAVDVQLATNAVLKSLKSIGDSDVNGDGVINATDIQLVVNRALHR